MREEELFYKAVDTFLFKSDFEVTDWLTDEEAEEYRELREALEEGGKQNE